MKIENAIVARARTEWGPRLAKADTTSEVQAVFVEMASALPRAIPRVGWTQRAAGVVFNARYRAAQKAGWRGGEPVAPFVPAREAALDQWVSARKAKQAGREP